MPQNSLFSKINNRFLQTGIDTFSHGPVHGVGFSFAVFLPNFVTMKIFEQRNWARCWVNWVSWALTVYLMYGVLSACVEGV